MKLIGTNSSPFVRKSRIVLAEKKIDYEFVIDSPWLAANAVHEHNPLGKVPVLLVEDDRPIFDSRVIVEYLDNLSPNAKLFPSNNRERTDARLWEALADGISDAASTIVIERRRPSKEQSKQWIARQHEKILRGLEFMGKELGNQSFCIGTHFCIADAAVGSTLGYLLFRFAELDWQTRHPNLAALYAKLALRPSFVETMPED